MKLAKTHRLLTKKLTATELRARILEAATLRFANFGFHGTGMRDIAAELEVTPPAIYHHFKDKDTLYLNVCQAAFSPRAAALDRTLSSDEPIELRILRFTESLVRLLEEDPVYFKLLQRELMERSLAEVRLLSSHEFLPQLTKLAGLIDALFPTQHSTRLAFNIYALALGYAQMSLVRKALPEDIDLGSTPAAISRLIVASILPGISLRNP